MIAKIKFLDGTEAVLEDSGTWECPDVIKKNGLNTGYNPRADDGPLASILPLGSMTPQRAVRELGVKIIYQKPIPGIPKGAVS